MTSPEASQGRSILDTTQIWTARTADGRPLDENIQRPSGPLNAALRRDGIPTFFRRSPYRDSRQGEGYVINTSALEQERDARQALRDSMAWIQHHFYPTGTPESPEVADLDDLSNVVMALPHFLMYRRDNPIAADQLPTTVGVMVKAAQGIQRLTKALVTEGMEAMPATGDIIYTLADNSGQLVGEEPFRPETEVLMKGPTAGGVEPAAPGSQTEVCAAPPNIIKETIQALLTGKGGDHELSEFNELIPDFNDLKIFTSAYFFKNNILDEFSQNKLLFVSDLIESGVVVDEAFLERLDDFNVRQNHLVDLMGSMQGIYNDALGHDPDSAPPVTRNEVDAWTNDELFDAYDEEVIGATMSELQVRVREKRAELAAQEGYGYAVLDEEVTDLELDMPGDHEELYGPTDRQRRFREELE